jgi:hypothetical protein
MSRSNKKIRDFFRQPAYGSPKKSGDGFHKIHATEHAIRRAKERYGVTLTQADIEEITRKIVKGDAEKIGVVQGKGLVFRVTYKDSKLVVAFTRKHGLVRTFLTEEMAAALTKK